MCEFYKLIYMITTTIIGFGGIILGALFSYWVQRVYSNRQEKFEVIKLLIADRNKMSASGEWVRAFNTVRLLFRNNEEINKSHLAFCELTKLKDFNHDDAKDILYKMIIEMLNSIGIKGVIMDDMKSFYGPSGK